MISPELLRRYPFFRTLSDSQLRAVAMLSQEIPFHAEEALFESGTPAQALFLLVEGNIDLYYVVAERDRPENCKEYLVGEPNAGEVFGVSALVEPYRYNVTARGAGEGRAVRIDAESLRQQAGQDPLFAYQLILAAAQALQARLESVHIQLAAAWA